MRTFLERAHRLAAHGRPLAFVAVLASAAVPFFVATLANEPAAQAMLAREATLRHLVDLADVVVEATPEESQSVWEDVPDVGRRIVTYTRISVQTTLAGSAPSGDLWVRTLGGIVGKIGQRVEGEAVLIPGERSVVFLKSMPDGTSRVVEMAQGHFPLRVDGGAFRLAASPHLAEIVARQPGKSARELLVGKLVSEAASVIRAERKAAGR